MNFFLYQLSLVVPHTRLRAAAHRRVPARAPSRRRARFETPWPRLSLPHSQERACPRYLFYRGAARPAASTGPLVGAFLYLSSSRRTRTAHRSSPRRPPRDSLSPRPWPSSSSSSSRDGSSGRRAAWPFSGPALWRWPAARRAAARPSSLPAAAGAAGRRRGGRAGPHPVAAAPSRVTR